MSRGHPTPAGRRYGFSRTQDPSGSQYHLGDDQLAHSQDPMFVRDLEAHQAAIDRMLARPGR